MKLIFDHPICLILLAAEAVVFVFLHRKRRRGGRLLLPIGSWGGEKFTFKNSPGVFWLYFSSALFWLALTLLVFAVADPHTIQKEKIYRQSGADILIALDESPSMFSTELGQTRFDIAKNQIKKFISMRENDSIGLMAYSSEAVLRVPLTVDYSFLVDQINRATERDPHLGSGTDIGMALAFGCYHLSHSSANEKVMVLLTDGLHNGGFIDPVQAAKAAHQMGIKVFPVGIGNIKEAVTVSVKDQYGNEIQGESAAQRNDALLRKIAAVTGGQFDASNSISVLEEAFAAIDRTLAVNTEGKIKRTKVSMVKPLLITVLSLLTAVFLIRKLLLRELP